MPKMWNALMALIFALACAQGAYAAPKCIMNSLIGKQLNLPIYEWVDNSKPRRGIIVAVPALTLYAQSWDDIARHLVDNGYQVFAVEMRGFGRWRAKDNNKFGGNPNIDFAQSQQDLLDVVITLHMAQPRQKLFCLGESLGSNMILRLLSEHVDLAAGAILVAPGYKNRVHPTVRWVTDFAAEVILPGSSLNMTPYAEQYVSTDKALTQAWSSDKMVYRRMTLKDIIDANGLNAQGMAAARNLPSNFPVLIIAGLDDGMFKTAELPKAIKIFGSHNVSLKLLAGRGHILLEHQPVDPKIASLIDKWLKRQSIPAKK